MLATVTDFLWSYVLVAVLVTMGLIFTIGSRFVQFRYFVEMFRVLGQAFKHQPGQVSSFQALTLSVAGRVGAGNIAGVAVAITLGGPGAVFWMWMVGLIGMATSFFESTLAQAYKTRDSKTAAFRGGPMYYIERGLGKRWLGVVFSVLLLGTFGLAFVALQSFVASSSLEEAFGVPTHITGIALTVIVGFTIFGGVQRISRVTEWLVPIMAVLYILVATVVIALNIGQVPAVLSIIVKSAFGLEQAIGGGIGAAIMMGVRRGLFSNEAGLGSAPNVAAVAAVPHPVNQGIVQSFSVFIDTAIICTATALIILLIGIDFLFVDAMSGSFERAMAGSENYLFSMHEVMMKVASDALEFSDRGVVLTQLALAHHVGPWGQTFVSVILLLFVFSSILYNFYLGENATNWINPDNRTMFIVFRVLMLILILWGSMQDLSTIFGFADLTMALLALVNLLALALMLKVCFRLMRDYDDQSRAGLRPVFDSRKFSDLDLDHEVWSNAADMGSKKPD
jgi:AGCS family alanine or glycine:cation symporter